MRAVVQRVSRASVSINGVASASIDSGLLVLLGVHRDDTEDDVAWIARKIANLRVFEDEKGLMNESLAAIDGSILMISQFTLIASVRKGNRPSFNAAAEPGLGQQRFNEVARAAESIIGKPVQTGVFGANMQVSLVNDGPVTIVFDSRSRE